MKSTVKRIFLALLMAFLCGAALTGCGSDDPASGSGNGTLSGSAK